MDCGIEGMLSATCCRFEVNVHVFVSLDLKNRVQVGFSSQLIVDG